MERKGRWMLALLSLGLICLPGSVIVLAFQQSPNPAAAPAPAQTMGEEVELAAKYARGDVETVVLHSAIEGQQHYFFPGTTYQFGYERDETFVEETLSVTGAYKRIRRSGMREEETTQGAHQGDNPDRLLPREKIRLGSTWNVGGDVVTTVFKWCGGKLTRLGLGDLISGSAQCRLASVTEKEARIDLDVLVKFHYEKGRGTHVTEGTFTGTMVFDREAGKIRSIDLRADDLAVVATWFWGQGIGEVKGKTKNPNTSNVAHGVIAYKRTAGGAPKPWESHKVALQESVNVPEGLKKYAVSFHSDRQGNFNIYSLDLATGACVNLSQTNSKGEFYDWNITWSPDGKRYAFASDREKGVHQIFTANADGSGLKKLTADGANAHLLWSPDGNAIAFTSTRDLPDPVRQMNNGELYVMKADGSEQKRLTNHLDPDGVPAWSPDSKRIAFQTKREGNYEVYVMNIDGTGLERLMEASPNTQEFQPAWSPDGNRIAFVTDRDGANLQNVYVYSIKEKTLKRLTYQQGQNFFPAFSPDGKWVVFCSMRGDNWDVWASDAEGTTQVQLTKHPGDDRYPQFIPKK